MFGIDDAILGPMLSLGSGLLSFEGSERANEENARLAREQMDFQERMSSTSYQRAVKDMTAAGLNPMLAYQHGGASTPGGALAQMQNSLGLGVSSAQRGMELQPQIQLLREQAGKTAAEKNVAVAQAKNIEADTLVKAIMLPKLEAETRWSTVSANQLQSLIDRLKIMTPAEYAEVMGRARLHHKTGEMQEAEAEHKRGQLRWGNLLSPAEYAERMGRARLSGQELLQSGEMFPLRKEALGLQLPLLRNEAAAQSSWWKRNVSPYLPDLSGTASSAARLFSLTR